MNLTNNEKMFLEIIKYPTIRKASSENILPSVMAAIEIVVSSWGTKSECVLTFNPFALPVDNNWFGKCYSLDTHTMYDAKKDCKEIGPRLIKAYGSYDEGITDGIEYFATVRRSIDGPLKYSAIFGCKSYIETINKLVRAGFMKDFMHKNDDVVAISNFSAIIEKYGLYLWDN